MGDSLTDQDIWDMVEREIPVLRALIDNGDFVATVPISVAGQIKGLDVSFDGRDFWVVIPPKSTPPPRG